MRILAKVMVFLAIVAFLVWIAGCPNQECNDCLDECLAWKGFEEPYAESEIDLCYDICVAYEVCQMLVRESPTDAGSADDCWKTCPCEYPEDVATSCVSCLRVNCP